MSHIFKATILCGLTFLFVNVAKADILIEPYLGYTMGNVTTTLDTGSTLKWDNNNAILGARVGYEFVVLMAGLDYDTMLSGKLKGQGGQPDLDATASQLYLFAGARLPLIRAWAGYGLMNEVHGKSGGVDTKYTGNSLKVGASFTGFPIIALNLEYIMNNFDKENDNALSTYATSKVESNLVMLSVSAPLSF